MKIKEFLGKEWKYFVGLALVIAVLAFAYFEYKEYRSQPVVPPPKVSATVETKDSSVIQYIPKTSPKDSDIEVNKALPKVSVSVNGQQHTFDNVQGETQKFDKGKLVLDQSSTTTIDVSAEVQKQVEQGITNAFKAQAKKPKVKVGVEGTVQSDVAAVTGIEADVNLRISRQSDDYDVDIRVNTKKQSVSVTRWF